MTPATAIPLRAEGLTRRVGEGAGATHVLRGISLAVPAGGHTAVIGPAGSGKSVLLHLLAGLDEPTEGTVTVAGQPLAGLGDGDVVRLRRAHVGLVLPDAGLIETISARENVVLPLRVGGCRTDGAHVDALLTHLGLAHVAGLRPDGLTEAERRRLILARALAARPSILLADEPAAGLDPGEARTLLAYLCEAARADGVAVVLATRDEAAAEWADHVVRLG